MFYGNHIPPKASHLLLIFFTPEHSFGRSPSGFSMFLEECNILRKTKLLVLSIYLQHRHFIPHSRIIEVEVQQNNISIPRSIYTKINTNPQRSPSPNPTLQFPRSPISNPQCLVLKTRNFSTSTSPSTN